jgi:hypothetical protein
MFEKDLVDLRQSAFKMVPDKNKSFSRFYLQLSTSSGEFYEAKR